MSTQPVSADKLESTRKNGARIQAEILRRLADVTQERAADCMGLDASTLSRFKDSLDRFCQLLAALDMQIAPTDSVVVSRDDLQALKRMAFKYLQAEIESEERG
ncbi:phage-related transcriptional transcriptional regulator [Bordetella bronchiseptica 1289]|uniref:CII family transcriptional regulator n=1 Tax=Bordetella bronchiseptica TaxID=518 RepID=UPI0002903AE3|nr:CII family transcriptional regulator [Bordetella bronchiseptica]CCN24141.1 phage-related transcriptional transcriptional regulator [Bordetella bronchiseptica 1289]